MKTVRPFYKLSVLSRYENKIIHGISQRGDGVSEGCYQSLNLGLHVGDETARVIENRKRFCGELGIKLSRTVCCEQVHGTNVRIVDEKDMGRGTLTLENVIENTDGLITNKKNIALMLFFADCTPVFIYDPRHDAVGLSHAGWRGTLGNIAAKTLRAMHDAYGTKPSDCIAAIGPCIGGCCYEIGDEVAEKFNDIFTSMHLPSAAFSRILFRDEGKYHLSLYEANSALLLQEGISSENISSEHCCTSCNVDEFYSYRAEKGKTGRHAAVICLK